MRTSKSAFASLLAFAAFAAVPGAAGAAPADNGACRQGVHDTLITLSEEGTVGDFISDGFYGNEPNEVAGHTVPSQSPGPKVTLPDGTVVVGSSWGDIQKSVIKPTCNA
jgi:hypothetical protein